MDIPLNALVYSSDGRVGVSTNVIVNPLTSRLTHLIVRTDERPHTEYMVPVNKIGETTPASINLHMSSEELHLQEPFSVTEFIPVQIPHYESMAYSWPLVQTDQVFEPVRHRQLPLGELLLRRGTKVKASDGPIGAIDEFLVNADGHVTHIVMRRGHLWGQKEVVIPIDDVKTFARDEVQLKLDKRQVGALPSIKIRR